MTFSTDLRERVIASVNSGTRVADAAKIFQVSTRVIYEWLELLEKTNSLAPKSGYQKGHSHKITDWDKFKIFAEKYKHCASPQMRIEWEKLTNVSMSESVMLRALAKIGYTSKKNFQLYRSQSKKT